MLIENGFTGALGAVLGAALAARVARECRERGADPAAFCAEAVEKAVAAAEKQRRRREKTPLAPETEARLRGAVAAALAEALDWASFGAALARRDLAMAPSGGGLELRRRSDGAPLAKASAVGPGYALLIRRFGAGMPGHPHAWLAERLLAPDRDAPEPPPRRRPVPDQDALLFYED